MIFRKVAVGMLVGLALVGCSKKTELAKPPVPPTTVTFKRQLVQTIEWGTVETSVRTTYASWVPGCIQVVNYLRSDNGQIESTQAEFSQEVCPADGLAEAVGIRAQFRVKSEDSKNIIYIDHDRHIGEYASDTVGGDTFTELTDLCTGDYDGKCQIYVENTRLKKIE